MSEQLIRTRGGSSAWAGESARGLLRWAEQATRKVLFPVFFSHLWLLMVFFPASLPAQIRAESELAKRLDAIVNSDEARKAFWGIEVFSPARGRTLYTLNAERYFTPASVTKLFPTAAALELLGPDYQFRTVVGTRSRIDGQGRLLGDLVLVGGGDPDLAGCDLPYVPKPKEADTEEQVEIEEPEPCPATQILDQLAAGVGAHGVRTVTGDLVVDTSFFAPERYPDGWTVNDTLWSYGAPVRAVSLADNSLVLRVKPGEQPDDPARLSWEPFTRFYEIRNQVRTTPEGSQTLLYVRREPGSRVLEVSGQIALDHRGRRVRVAVEAPAEMTAELFRQALESAGVRVLGKVVLRHAPAPPRMAEETGYSSVVLAEHLSLPLAEDIRLINKVSQNLHAEMLLRLLGRQPPPETRVELPERPRRRNQPLPRVGDGSVEAGLRVLRAWLANAGVNPDDVAFRDGSGLSRKGMVTPHAVVQLLQYAAAQPWGPLYLDSFPIAGVDGTLEERMEDSSATARVRAKTGSLSNNNGLAGYVQTISGERLLMAIFINHHTLENKRALELIDQICTVLVELPAAKEK